MEQRRIGRPPGRTVRNVSFALAPDLIDMLTAYADSRGISRSAAVSELLFSSKQVRSAATTTTT